MTTRIGWVLEGLRTGIVTTHYPSRPDPDATAGVRVWPRVRADHCRADAGCETCIHACLPNALTFLPGHAGVQETDGDDLGGKAHPPQDEMNATLVLDLGKCIGCGLCAQMCPHDAMSMAQDGEVATRDTDALRQRLPLAIVPDLHTAATPSSDSSGESR
jgi:formate hydrogenlyase subunit 6/NADH:ubiquinone oxidoreductase subunit I